MKIVNTWVSEKVRKQGEYSDDKESDNVITCLSWGPAFNPISFNSLQDKSVRAPMRFVTGGTDNKVRLWTKRERYIYDCEEIHTYSKWVRDVSWLHYLGNSYDIIASCSEDGSAHVFAHLDDSWKIVFEKSFNGNPVWNVSWSNCGSHLAISTSENNVFIYRQNLNGKWDLISKVDEQGQAIEEGDRNHSK